MYMENNQENQSQQPNPGNVITPSSPPNSAPAEPISPQPQVPSAVPQQQFVPQQPATPTTPGQSIPPQTIAPQQAPVQPTQYQQQSPQQPVYSNPSNSTPPMPTQGSSKKGSKKLILIVAIIVAVFILSGSTFAFISSSKKKTEKQATQNTGQTTENKEATGDDSNQPSAQGVAITKSYELNVVCEGTGWPTNVTSSTDGTKKTMVFDESASTAGEYKQTGGVLNKANQTNYDDQTNVDYVACLKRTDTATENVTCDYKDRDKNPIKATMVRKDFSLTVYDLKSKKKVVQDTKVPATKKCGMIALLNAKNEFDADPDEQAIKVEIAKL